MKLKLIKELDQNGELLPIDSIIEVEDEVQAQGLIEDGTAIQYTEEVEIEEEVEAIKEEAKTIKNEIETKSLENKEIKNMNTFGKAIKDAIESKAVTTYASTEATQPLGIVGFDIGLGGKCRQMPIKGNLNIVYSATETTSAELPLFDIVAENTAAATTVALVQYSALPAKNFATVTVPNEYMEDVAQMEAFVSQELTKKANATMDKSILRGAFTNNYGLKGVIASTDTVAKTATLSAIAVTDLHGMVGAIIPELQPACIWVINPNTWAQLLGSLLDVDNVNSQLITDGANKTLLGYPVKVSTALQATTPIVFGDFSQYLIGVDRVLTVEVDRSVAFLTDSTALRVSYRLAGGPACSKKQIDSVEYGAFVKVSAA